MAFGIIGFLGFIGCLIWLVVVAIRKQPKKQSLIGLAICFVLFVVGISLPSSETPATTTPPKASSSKVTEKSSKENQVSSVTPIAPESKITDGAVTVSFKTLYKDYEDNAIAADKKYKDKKLILTGTIANIDRDIGKSPYITFNVDEYGAQSIKMSFDNDDAVASLKKGQTITVVGTCGGTFVSTIVILNDCTVVK